MGFDALFKEPGALEALCEEVAQVAHTTKTATVENCGVTPEQFKADMEAAVVNCRNTPQNTDENLMLTCTMAGALDSLKLD